MQVDGYLPDFGQADLPPCNRVGFELRKQHGLHLSKLLEAWKAKSSFLEVVPSVMQTTDRCLQNLRRGFSQQREFFLRLAKFVLLNVVRWEMAYWREWYTHVPVNNNPNYIYAHSPNLWFPAKRNCTPCRKSPTNAALPAIRVASG